MVPSLRSIVLSTLVLFAAIIYSGFLVAYLGGGITMFIVAMALTVLLLWMAKRYGKRLVPASKQDVEDLEEQLND